LFVIIPLISLLLLYYRKSTAFTQLQHAHKILSQENEVVLSFIREIGDALTSARELDQLFRLIITCSKRTFNAASGAIFLLNEDHTFLKAKIVDGLFPPIFEMIPPESLSKLATKAKYIQDLIMNLQIALGEGIVGGVAQSRTSILIKDALTDQRIPQPVIDFLKVKTLMVVPLVFKEEVIGVMIAANKEDGTSFDETDLSLLESLADQAAISIHNARLYQEIAEKERLDKELQIATQVQRLLLPLHFPKISGFEFAALNRPAREIGGDYYDFFQIGEDQYGIVIADVSGKGIPAALVMTMARSILRSLAPGNTSPRHVLSELNRHLFSDIQQEMFISLAYLTLDQKNKKLSLTRAGHEPIIYFNHQESSIKLLRPQGIVLGMEAGPLFTSTLEEVLLVLKEGDILALYTDGVTEAQDNEGNEFGYEALIEAIHSSSHMSAQEIANHVMARILRFTGNIPQRDDTTLVIVKAH
jgi:sigma-B regulation protein RsbU (phosphoserine phosphatase)